MGRFARQYGWPILLALPALVLAGAGLLHPHHLSYETSQRWFALHVPGLLVFPLVGVSLAALVGWRRDALAWAVRVSAYGYATFYTALDVVSGIGAGYVTHQLGPGVARPEAVSQMFRIGTPLGEIGSIALLACCALVAGDALRRHGPQGAVALVLLPGAWLVHVGHIFAPEGTLGMLLLAVGTAGAAVLDTTRPEVAGEEATSSAPPAS